MKPIATEFTKFSLDALDQECSLEKDEYKNRLKDAQLRLLKAQLALRDINRAVIIVFEGPDAAGKGGAIRRISEKLDPRTCRVYSIVKPTPEEYAHHYMRRFWLRLPSYGQIGIFDRSWYGRVLVERVESFATTTEWKRAYDEINTFEKLLTDDGSIIIKIFLQITKDEQLRRFKKRQEDPYKHWKISDEDWRNREKWQQHIESAEDMFRRTSTPYAPWSVIPGNYKWFARVETLRILCERLEKEFNLQ